MTTVATAVVKQTDRSFYMGMAMAAVAAIFVGFARTFFLRGYMALPAGQADLSPLLLTHGVVATTWIVLFAIQTSLIAVRQVSLHRRLGMVGGAVAIVMVAVGILTAVDALRRGVAPFGIDTRSWVLFPLAGIISYAGLVTTALVLRQRPQSHKRLMLLATIGLLNPALGRLAAPLATNLFGFMALAAGLTDLFLLAVVFRDLQTRGHVSRVVLWGGLTVFAVPFVLVPSGTSAWLAFADRLL